jgi:hypothetical protein
VAGAPVFFEAGVPLVPASETLVCAFFLHAMREGAGLVVHGSLDSCFVRNLGQARSVACEWWGFPGGEVRAEEVEPVAPAGGTGLYFTGGVDSFYSLYRNAPRLDTLVYVEGFDVALNERARLQKLVPGLRSVAESCGLEFFTVRTDLREHRPFAGLNWEITHGAALAAVAHLLRRSWSTVMISGANCPPPWGTHPQLDPAWSSGAVRVVNVGHDLFRLDKVRVIADWPLVHEHLHVCWENRTADLNCGMCEKCVRTQLEFRICGFLDKVKTFPKGSLTDRIESLPSLSPLLRERWSLMLEWIDDRKLRRATERLIERSRGA